MPPISDDASLLSSLPREFTVPQGWRGARLDVVLGHVLPGMGLRGRRRLWDWCRILVNGKARPPGYAVVCGDLVRLETRSPSLFSSSEPQWPSLRLMALHGDLAAFAKPGGVHTVRIAGSPGRSLEEYLEKVWPDIRSTLPGMDLLPADLPVPRLLTRLDRETSGLVLVALTREGEMRFRELEHLGRVEKTYDALVCGRLEKKLLLRNRLLTDNRMVTEVLEEADCDSARHTLIRPASMPEGRGSGACTLVKAVIRRGARHQIRVHLAHAGYPIVGDSVYGGVRCPVENETEGENRLFLHHSRIVLPGFCAELTAAWLPRWRPGPG